MPLTLLLVFSSFRRERLRPFLAVLGVATAVGLVVWSLGLSMTTAHQSRTRASAMTAPFDAWVSVPGIGELRGRRAGGGRGRVDANGLPPELADALREAGAEVEAYRIAHVKIDARPGGRILQGPPLTAGLVESDARGFPFANGKLTAGRWPAPDTEAAEAVFCTGAYEPRRLPPPELGSTVTLQSREGAVDVTVVGIVDFPKSVGGFPAIFASRPVFRTVRLPVTSNLLLCKRKGVSAKRLSACLPKSDGRRPSFTLHTPDEIAASLSSDSLANFKRQAPLLFTLCILTALCMLGNALSIGLERRIREYALLRCAGMTAHQVARVVALEGTVLAFAGWLLGVLGGYALLVAFVTRSPATFPEGAAFGWQPPAAGFALTAVVSIFSLLAPCRAALRIRPLDTVRERAGASHLFRPFLAAVERFSAAPFARLLGLDARLLRTRLTRHAAAATGMALTLAAGLGTYTAIHIWGASLMKPFIPSPEFPDVIVSFLPNGIEGDLAGRVAALPGVRDHACAALEAVQVPYGDKPSPEANVLLLGSDPGRLFGGEKPLARFRFDEGDSKRAASELVKNGACVITKMFSRGTGLHAGDELKLPGKKLRIAGVVDLNWHLVTSRGQLRGRNGSPPATMGPVFVTEETARAFSRNADRTYFLWANLGGDCASAGALQGSLRLEEQIKECLDRDTGMNVIGAHHRDEIADGTIAHGADLIGDMARAPFWSLVILCAGVITFLVSSYEVNAREFATMRAVGLTRGQLARILLGETLMVATAGILLSLLLGFATGFAFTFLTRASMNFVGLPVTFVIPWWKLASGILFALCLSLTMAAAPIAWLIRRRVNTVS
ncbi:MAG: ABC transporter permease [Kiritimatiellae bacterium]|nr:ABC transporter permease [Kiritimatiellia bacterium]